MLALAGLVMGNVYRAAAPAGNGDVGQVVGTALIQVPAIWVLTGLAVALVGVRPRLAGWTWAALVGFLLVGQLGAILQFPQWILDLSPFTHVPMVPAEAFRLLPLVILVVVSAGLCVVGWAGLRSRDLEPG
jgi:ABC-2 type transport system permease protein